MLYIDWYNIDLLNLPVLSPIFQFTLCCPLNISRIHIKIEIDVKILAVHVVIISGITGLNFNLVNMASSYTMLSTESDYGLLLVDGGKVYYSGMSRETLNWICRMLGYQSYYHSTSNTYSSSWQQSLPVRYRYLECSGSAVPQCRYKKYGTSNSNALSIYCTPRTQYGDSSEFYLAGKDQQHTQKEHGLLMYNGGTVSGKKFDDSTAELVCRIMGYEGVMSWTVGRKYMPGQKDLSISLSSVNCLTKDRPFPLCTYGTDVTNSTHDEDVWLWCDMPNTNDLVCPPGQKKSDSNKCYECQPHTYSPEPSTSTSCLSCPSRSSSLTGSTYCFCNEGTYMSSDNDECLECPRNSTSLHGSSFCSCVAGTYLYSDLSSCVLCPKGTVSKEGGTAPSDCVSCPAGSVPLNNGQVCSCEKGYGWEWGLSKEQSCKVCPANSFKDKRQGICVQCPDEATSLPLSEECHCPSGLSWDGESCVNCTSPDSSSGVCDCSAGTFWSEDTSLCEPCPENHFSGQFFSVCSKCPVFTVSQSRSSECSSCPKGYSWINQTCIECPENHVGNGVTCSFCPEGTSPSKDNTICQKSAVDALLIAVVSSIVLNILIFAMVIGIILYIWKEKREKNLQEDIHMVYRADLSTTDAKVRGRRCMCPSCNCSEVAKPALPKRGNTLQQDDIYINN